MKDRICLRALWTLAFALSILTCFVHVEAAQTRTFTITKPAGYVTGEGFGTETLVYLVYDAATNAQLFSTFTLVTTKTNIPDGAQCFYARAGVYDETNNKVLVGADGKSTLSDPSPNSCTPTTPPPAPATKQVGAPALVVQ